MYFQNNEILRQWQGFANGPEESENERTNQIAKLIYEEKTFQLITYVGSKDF